MLILYSLHICHVLYLCPYPYLCVLYRHTCSSNWIGKLPSCKSPIEIFKPKTKTVKLSIQLVSHMSGKTLMLRLYWIQIRQGWFLFHKNRPFIYYSENLKLSIHKMSNFLCRHQNALAREGWQVAKAIWYPASLVFNNSHFSLKTGSTFKQYSHKILRLKSNLLFSGLEKKNSGPKIQTHEQRHGVVVLGRNMGIYSHPRISPQFWDHSCNIHHFPRKEQQTLSLLLKKDNKWHENLWASIQG